MILNATTKKLQVVLGEAHTTNALDITCAYTDTDSGSTLVPAVTTIASNGTTAVDVAPAPAAGTTQRQVTELWVYNNDTVQHTVYLRYNNNGTIYIIKKKTIQAGESFFYSPVAQEGAQGATGATGDEGPAGAGYDIVVSAAGPRLDGEKLLIFVADRTYTLLTGLPGSYFSIGSNPSGTVVFNFYKGASNIGNLSITSGGVQTLTFSNDVTFSPGDIFSITAPSPNDATMTDIGFTIKTFGAEGTTNVQYPSIENRIINGDFIVDQRNEFAAITPSTAAANIRVADCWNAFTTQGSKLTYQVVTDNPGEDAVNSLQITVATALTAASTDQMYLEHVIEGINVADAFFGTASAQPIFVTFWMKASIAGNYSLALCNSAKNRRFLTVVNVPVGGVWYYFTVAFPGDTAGTWLNGENTVGLRLKFDLGCGTNFRGSLQTTTYTSGDTYSSSGTAVRLVANLGATLQLAKVRARVGATFDAPAAPRLFKEELALCQRYFYKTFKRGVAPAQNAGVAGAVSLMNPVANGRPSIRVPFPVTMANPSPTITTYNPSAANANWRDITAAADITATVDPGATLGPDGVTISAASVTNAADVLAIHLTADGSL